MPWNQNDPLEARRRQLAEQERLLAEQRRRLTEELLESGQPSPADAKPAEPPVWRMEDDALHQRPAEPAPARKRNLARQRRRDMILAFALILILILIIVIVIVFWVAHVHDTGPVNGG
ncbi:MAG TPA: hypothetical protein VGZ93_10430 [Candidatus Methylacidiphilales bacterium]|jgi:hypothetical protein|nr:hypothetical protein [Candidatus Methylacidiphilales bacterium]